MITIAIVDDSSIFINILKAKLHDYFFRNNIQVEIHSFSLPQEIIDFYDIPAKFHYVFLDFDMGEINGYECGKQLRKICKTFKLIYVTSFDETIYKCLDNEVFGFVRKSNFDNDIDSCLNRILLNYSSTFVLHNFKCAEGLISLNSSQILYFEFSKRSIYIYTANSSYRITKQTTLSEIYIIFKDFSFIYICKGILVNLNNIKSIVKDEITLVNNQNIKIAKRRVQDVTYAYYSMLRR